MTLKGHLPTIDSLVFGENKVLAHRVFPLLVAVSLLSVVAFSQVPSNLWIFNGSMANTIMAAYAVTVLVLAVRPKWETLHFVGAPLAVLTFVGRAGGFLELILERGEWSLIGAVSERLVLALALVLWHRARVGELELEHERRKVSGDAHGSG